MNGVFFFSTILFFFTIHILLQSTYQHHDSYRTVIFLSVPEFLIFMICLFLNDVSYFLNYIFSYFIVLNCIFFFFSYFEKKKKLYHFSFLFLTLYLFVIYAISFHTKEQSSISNLLSFCSFFFFFFFTLKKEKEVFSWKRILYFILLMVQTFFLYFLGKIYLCSPSMIGILCALPKCFIFFQLKENNTFSYFLKDEFYHFFLISLFGLLTPFSIFYIYEPYFLNCCHFGMFSHILFLFSCLQKKESYKILFAFLFVLGFLIFFFRKFLLF